MNNRLYRLFPALIFIGFFFCYAIIYSFMLSVGLNPIVGEELFTLEHYKNMFQGDFINTFWYSIYISFTTTILALIISIIILFFLSFYIEYSWVDYLFNTFRIPMIIPYLIASYMVFVLLMDNGALSSLVYLSTGENISFSFLINDKKGIGIIIAYLWKTIPFFIMMSFPVLKRIHGHWDELIHTFDINKYKFFLHIALPLLLPSLMVSFFIVIAFIFSAFEVPYILGTINPRTLPIYVYNIYAQGDLSQRPYLMAVNLILSVFSIVMGLIMYYFYQRVEKNIKGWQ